MLHQQGQSIDQKARAAVLARMPEFKNDPLGFVLYAYPWGIPGTPLADEPGPDTWQVEAMHHIRDQLAINARKPADMREAIRVAAATGHGVGKTTLMAWLVQWFIATRPNPAIVVTANTENQLRTKTWRELSKWHKMSLIEPWFEWTATQYRLIEEPEMWFATALPWSEHNAEAFAGTHEKYVMVLMDEGSAIADTIYDVVEGALTGEEAIQFVAGNPTRNTGRFRDIFRKFAHRWKLINVDSRNARKTNKAQLKQWAEDWGEDSNFFKVRVLGQFPDQASNQLNSEALINAAVGRRAAGWEWEPIIIGVDVARYGDDFTVIVVRQGSKLHEVLAFNGLDTVAVAEKIIEVYGVYRRDGEGGEPVIFIDTTGGLGAGPLDFLKRAKYKAFEVVFGNVARRKDKYFNKRAEMWILAHEWLRSGQLPDSPELKEDLLNIEYYIHTDKRLRLEDKKDLKERLGRSPDWGDALAVTFAYPVRSVATSPGSMAEAVRQSVQAQIKRERGGGLKTLQRMRRGR